MCVINHNPVRVGICYANLPPLCIYFFIYIFFTIYIYRYRSLKQSQRAKLDKAFARQSPWKLYKLSPLGVLGKHCLLEKAQKNLTSCKAARIF